MHSRYIALKTAMAISRKVRRCAACTASPDPATAHVTAGVSYTVVDQQGRPGSREAAESFPRRVEEEVEALASEDRLDSAGQSLVPEPETPALDREEANSAKSETTVDQEAEPVGLFETIRSSEVSCCSILQVIV